MELFYICIKVQFRSQVKGPPCSSEILPALFSANLIRKFKKRLLWSTKSNPRLPKLWQSEVIIINGLLLT